VRLSDVVAGVDRAVAVGYDHLGGLRLAEQQKSPSRDGMAVNKQGSLSRVVLVGCAQCRGPASNLKMSISRHKVMLAVAITPLTSSFAKATHPDHIADPFGCSHRVDVPLLS
jgi:hypothetical protein